MAIHPTQRRDGVHKNVIYALKLRTSSEFRYVGQASREVASRFYLHLWEADRGSMLPIHRWVRKHRLGVECVVLEQLPQGDELNFREQFWIAALRESGNRLLNVSDGGGGTLGRRISEAQRTEHSDKMTGQGNPMFGRKFSPEHRENISNALKGKPSWAAGKTFSEEHRNAISKGHADVSGNNNPFWGKAHDSITRAKMASAAHKRYHVDLNLVNYLCITCLIAEEDRRGHSISWSEIIKEATRLEVNQMRHAHRKNHVEYKADNCFLCHRVDRE